MRALIALLGAFACSTPDRDARPEPAPRLGSHAFVWSDVVSGARWALSATEVDWATAHAACPAPWRMPDTSELGDAWARGLEGPLVWGRSISGDQALTFSFEAGKLGVADKKSKAGTACIKPKEQEP